ncbi:MAG: hypothetical protein ACR2JB_01450 [Bryobacteraceae bacterium]
MDLRVHHFGNVVAHGTAEHHSDFGGIELVLVFEPAGLLVQVD